MSKISKLRELMARPLEFKIGERFRKALVAVLIFIVVYLILMVTIIPSRVDLDLGKPSPQTIYAPRDSIDTYATERLRKTAEEAVPEVFDYDPELLTEAQDGVNLFFEGVFALQAEEELTGEEKADRLQGLLADDISVAALKTFLTADSTTLTDLQRRLKGLLAEIYNQGVKDSGLETAQRYVNQEIALFPFGSELKRVSESLVKPLIKPNMIYNPEATATNREAAANEIDPVIILSRTLIISKGEMVTERHLEQLESLGLALGSRVDYPGFIALFLLLLTIFAAVGIYIALFVKNVYNSTPLIALLGLVVVITLIFAIAGNYFSGYLVPVAMGVILITVMLGARLAILMNIILALLVGLITGGDFVLITMTLVGGLAAIYRLSQVSRRSDLSRAGLYVAAANMIVIIAFFLFQGNLDSGYGFLKDLGYGLLAGVGNGLFSSIVAIGLLPFLESGFGLTTAITLLELSNPNNPLLRRLMTEAPGTYYHSIMVGNLAEGAAEAVGADPLLTRVGAYYHDIGKLKRPYFFVENQFSGANPHEKLSPNLSALIIGSHVKDGVELARQYRLPAVVQDIINQHHGDSLISFFYQQALESGGKDNKQQVSEDQFRYEGPLPQTKEAAIIMLADTVEAGVRSLSKPVIGRVEALIRKAIRERLNDGQLDECNLTLKELDQIGDSFVNIMTGIYHSRIEYPEKDLRAEIERVANR
ncbi:MAG: HDIG domain-containing protein [Firmicutes bacterium]|nr:HDIG domain-containing protein [Bacillota bacterium]